MNSSLSSKNDMKFNFQATAMDWFRARAHLESKLNDWDSKVYIRLGALVILFAYLVARKLESHCTLQILNE